MMQDGFIQVSFMIITIIANHRGPVSYTHLDVYKRQGLNYDQKQQLKTKRLLAAQGFYEASTLAFYSNAERDMLHIPADDEARKAIRILNPISENLSIMRTLLTPPC